MSVAGPKIVKDDDGGFFLSLLLLVGFEFMVEMYLLVVLLMTRSVVVLTFLFTFGVHGLRKKKKNDRHQLF